MNYNPIASQYDSFESTAVTVWKIGYPEVCRILGDMEGQKVLDYGCGTGTFSRILRDGKALVTGVDVSEEMIHIAQANHAEGIQYRRVDSGDLGFLPGEEFDSAVANFVLCTIPTKAGILKVMESIRRVLKKGGRLVIMNANWERSNGKEFVSFRLDFCPDLISGVPVTATIKSDPPMSMKDFFWSKDDYLEMLRAEGFTLEQILEPLGDRDHNNWMDESAFPPYLIISASLISIVPP